MAVKISASVKNGMLNAIETAIGTTAVLKLRTGAAPAAITDADSGDVVCTITLPEDWMAAANAGAKAKEGTWTEATADADGTVAHFRIYASDGTTQHIQGTVTATGDGGDLTLDNVVIAQDQAVTINTFTLTAGN